MSRPRRVYWDRWEGEPFVPTIGDYVYGPRALYRVVDARPVESATNPDRFRLDLRRVGDSCSNDLVEFMAAEPDARGFGSDIVNSAHVHENRARWAAEERERVAS